MPQWLIRVALVAWPAPWRDRHGRALAQTLERAWADDRRPSNRIALLADAVHQGLAVRVATPANSRTALVMIQKGPTMHTILWDIRAAWRSLSTRPLFSATVTATLALGLGATTAMFSVVNGVLLRPLPFPNDRELVTVTEVQHARNRTGASLPGFDDWSHFPEFVSTGAYEPRQLLFNQTGVTERVDGLGVSPGFFHTLGVAPALGWVMQPGDPLLDPAPKIVLSHAVWMRQFNGDPSVIGRDVMLEQSPYTVVAVMPSGFEYPTGSFFWTTLPPSMQRVADDRMLRFVDVIARLAPGRTAVDAQGRLTEWSARVTTLPGNTNGSEWQAQVTGLRDATIGAVRPALLVVFGGVCLLLLVACANVAALVLARGRARLRDLAVQSALGATRFRLMRQLLVEGLLLAFAGAAIAVVIAGVTRDGIIALSVNQIPRIENAGLDLRVVAFVLAAGILTTGLVALGPAVLLTRTSNIELMQQSSRSSTGSRTGRRVFGALVAVEFALALALVAGAALLLNSYVRLRDVDTGMRPQKVAAAQVNIPLTPAWSGRQGDETRRRFHADLIARVNGLPGVERAALIGRLPLDVVKGGIDMQPEGDPSRAVRTVLQTTSEGYLDTIGARLLAGRDFTDRDAGGAPVVAIINDLAARQLFPDGNAVGRTVAYTFMQGPVTATVIGVVRAVRYNGLTTELQPECYVSFRQAPNLPLYLVFRTSTDPMSMVPAIRAQLTAADATATVTFNDIASFDTRLSRAVARPRFYLVLVGVFAAIAFVLAALGIYGTIAFWISERWREFGIRLALGATGGDVTALVVRRGLALAGAGVAAGLVGTYAASRFIEGMLFGVRPTDLPTLASAALALSVVAFVACLVPARRVARIDPVVTLRAE